MKKWLVIVSPHTPFGPLTVADKEYQEFVAAYREVRQPPNQRTRQRGRGYTLVDTDGGEHTLDLSGIEYIRGTEAAE